MGELLSVVVVICPNDNVQSICALVVYMMTLSQGIMEGLPGFITDHDHVAYIFRTSLVIKMWYINHVVYIFRFPLVITNHMI